MLGEFVSLSLTHPTNAHKFVLNLLHLVDRTARWSHLPQDHPGVPILKAGDDLTAASDASLLFLAQQVNSDSFFPSFTT